MQQRNWLSETYTILLNTIPSKKGVAAFDFDNTIVYNDFGEEVMNTLLEQGLPFLKEEFSDFFPNKSESKKIFENRKTNIPKFKEYILKHYSEIANTKGVEASYRWSSFLFSGSSANELKEYSQTVWENQKTREDPSRVFPYPEMLDLIQFLNENDWDVYIVTASPELVIQSISKELGIEPNKVIGMELKLKNRFLSSEILEPYTYGLGKVKAFQNKTGKLPDLAMGDSMNDFPLLESAKLSIALDKGNQDFIDKCKDRNFFIQKRFI